MNWNEYVRQAMRTAPDNLGRHQQLVVGALGLNGELAELSIAVLSGNTAHIKEEAGDVCWYLALAGLSDLNLFEQEWPKDTMHNPLQDLMIRCMASAGLFADKVKKHIGQGHAWTSGPPHQDLVNTAFYLHRLLAAHAIGWEEVLDHNVSKLRKRYPEGFSVEKSVHRAED